MGIITKTIAVASALGVMYLLGSTGACNYLTRRTSDSSEVRDHVADVNRVYCRTIDMMVEHAVRYAKR